MNRAFYDLLARELSRELKAGLPRLYVTVLDLDGMVDRYPGESAATLMARFEVFAVCDVDRQPLRAHAAIDSRLAEIDRALVVRELRNRLAHAITAAIMEEP